MTTPIWLFGFNTGLLSTSGTGMINALTGTPVIQSTVKHSGSYCMQCNPASAAATYATKNISGGSVLVGRVYYRFDTAPSGVVSFFAGISSSDTFAIQHNPTTGKFRAIIGATAIDGNDTLVSGTWYCIDFRFDCSTTTAIIDWKVDGVDQTQVSISDTTGTFSSVRFGLITAVTGNVYLDDIILSSTSADYPFGAGGTDLLKPNFAIVYDTLTDLKDQGGSALSAGCYNLIDEVPMNSTADYITQVSSLGASYVSFSFTTYSRTITHGAVGHLAYKSSATQSNNGACLIRNPSDSIDTAIWGSDTAQADYSENALFYKSALIGFNGTIVSTDINALRGEVGYSTDATPNPQWHSIILEVAYGTPTQASGTLNKTLDAATITASGTITGTATTEGQLIKTVDNATSSSVASVVVNGTSSKTLDDFTKTANGQVVIGGSTNKSVADATILSSGTAQFQPVSGSLVKSVDDVARSANATVLVQGTLNKTTDATGIGSSGKVGVSGTLTSTIGVTSLVNGTVSVAGSINKTLDSVSVISDGLVQNQPASGILSKTIDDVGRNIVATVIVQGSTNSNVASVTSGSSGKVDVTGSLAATIGTGLQASGKISIQGSTNKNLDSATIVSDGLIQNQPASGDLNKTLDDVSRSAVATVSTHGSANATLDSVGKSIIGSVRISGVTQKTIDDCVSSSNVDVIVNGVFNQAVGNTTVTSAGGLGILNYVVDAVVDNVSFSSSGKVEIAGSVVQTLSSATSGSTTQIIVSGASSKNVGDVTLIGTGSGVFVPVTGTLATTTGTVLGSGNGTVLIKGAVNKSVDNVGISAYAGENTLRGVTNKTTGDVVSSSATQLQIKGQLSRSLGDVGGSFTANVISAGNFDLTINDATLISNAQSIIQASIVKPLSDVAISNSGTVQITGNANLVSGVTSTVIGSVEIKGALEVNNNDVVIDANASLVIVPVFLYLDVDMQFGLEKSVGMEQEISDVVFIQDQVREEAHINTIERINGYVQFKSGHRVAIE